MIRSPAAVPIPTDHRPPDSLFRGRRTVFGVILVIFATLSLAYVRQTGDVAATGYDVAQLQRDKTQWLSRNDQLHLEVARLESLDRISQAASDRLHLGPPRREIYVRSTPVAVPAPPSTPTASAAAPESPIVIEFRRLLGVP